MGRGERRPANAFNGRTAWLAAIVALFLCPVVAAQEKPEAYILRLQGTINEAYARAVQSRIQKAVDEGVETFILELDTPGGTVSASMELGDFVFRQEEIDVIAYVNDQAYSGGTMLALACKEIYIDATTGRMGDVAPIGPGGEIHGEKIQSPIRTTMTSYGRKRGYPEALVKAMVTKELVVYRITTVDDPRPAYITEEQLNTMGEEELAGIVDRELIVSGGELLSVDAARAVEYGFARQAVRSRQHLYEVLELDPDGVDRLFLTGSERLLTVLDTFSPLLIVGGVLLLYIELTHPGFGLPGILGIGCFVGFFVIKWTLNYAHMLEILLFVGGLALLLIEIFIIPGFGVAGVSGIILLFISLVLTFQQFTIPRNAGEFRVFQWSLLKVSASLACSVVGVAILLRYLPAMPVFRRIIHQGSLAAASASEGLERRNPHLAEMVGEVGVAQTALRPAGRAEFGDRLMDVVTEGEFVDRGDKVRIREIHGNRIVVEPYREV